MAHRHRHTGTQAHRHAGTQAHRQAGTQAGRHTGTQAHRHTGTQAHRHTGTQAHRHKGTQAHRHTGTQAHRHTGTQAHRHTINCAHKKNIITTSVVPGARADGSADPHPCPFMPIHWHPPARPPIHPPTPGQGAGNLRGWWLRAKQFPREFEAGGLGRIRGHPDLDFETMHLHISTPVDPGARPDGPAYPPKG